MFKTSDNRKKLFTAILNAKKNFATVVKDASNPYFNSKYETLNGVLEAVESALNKEGVILVQPSSSDGNNNYITTRLEHVESGEYIDSTLKLELQKPTMQECGSAATYARRQTLKGLLSLQSEDDDANSASKAQVVPVGSKSSNTPNTEVKRGRPAKEKTAAKGEAKVTQLPTKVANGYAGNSTNQKPVSQVNEEEW